MDYRFFALPTENQPVKDIELYWCNLYTRLRNGEQLDEVELDWMDTANNWLMSRS